MTPIIVPERYWALHKSICEVVVVVVVIPALPEKPKASSAQPEEAVPKYYYSF